MSDAKVIVGQLYQRLNAGDLTVVDDLVSDDFVEHEEFPGLAPNKEGLRQLFTMFHAGFENAKFEVDDLIGEGDKVFVRARMTGTHRGEFMGVPATGRTVDVGVGDYLRLDGDLIVEHWGVMDTGRVDAATHRRLTSRGDSHGARLVRYGQRVRTTRHLGRGPRRGARL